MARCSTVDESRGEKRSSTLTVVIVLFRLLNSQPLTAVTGPQPPRLPEYLLRMVELKKFDIQVVRAARLRLVEDPCH